MKEQGYETVICDMIPYEYAKLIGITPILLTSSVESLKSAINHAVDSWSKHEKLYDSFSMLENLVRSSSNRYLILDIEEKSLFYFGGGDGRGDGAAAKKRIAPVSFRKTALFFCDSGGTDVFCPLFSGLIQEIWIM